MNTAQIIAEFRKLSRPCQFLAAANPGDQILGVWGGTKGVVPPPPGLWEHRLTIDCTWLARNGFNLRGCLSVYGDAGGKTQNMFTAVNNPQAILPAEFDDGIPLSGLEQPSLPPIEDIVSSGQSLIEGRLKALGVSVNDLWKKEFRRSEEADRYDRDYHESCPLEMADTEGIYAAMGGWHLMWPDDEAYERDGRLVLWTFHGGEPYLEVWLTSTGELRVQPRTG